MDFVVGWRLSAIQLCVRFAWIRFIEINLFGKSNRAMPSKCEILFDNNVERIVYSGQLVVGRVVLTLDVEESIKSKLTRICGIFHWWRAILWRCMNCVQWFVDTLAIIKWTIQWRAYVNMACLWWNGGTGDRPHLPSVSQLASKCKCIHGLSKVHREIDGNTQTVL